MNVILARVNEQLAREADGYSYRGYFIRYSALQGLAYISKQSTHIGSARTCRLAEREIDALILH